MFVKLLFLFLTLTSFRVRSLHADGAVKAWFEKMNVVSSTNTAAVVADKSLGVHFLGGTGVMRGKVSDLNPVHINFPHFSAGCGGVSYSMGALSLISGEEIVDALKNIMSNAGTYAFELALHTATPIIASISGDLQKYANDFNAININSCQIARSAVNAAWPNSEGASQYICQHAGDNLLFKGLIERRQNCSGNKDGIEYKTNHQLEQNSDALLQNYNLTWKILNNPKWKNLSDDDKNLLLNLTGTIIRNRQNGNTSATIYAPQGQELWLAIIDGGTIPDAYFFVPQNKKDKNGQPIVGSIDEVQAGIQTSELKITAKEAWAPTFLNAMKSLLEKIKQGRSAVTSRPANQEDQPDQPKQYALSKEEQKLLNGNALPIGTLLVISSRSGIENFTSLSKYASLEAFKRLSNFFFDVLEEIREMALSLSSAQISGVSEEDIHKYLKYLDRTRKELSAMEQQLQQEINHVYQFEQFIRARDDYLRSLGGM